MLTRSIIVFFCILGTCNAMLNVRWQEKKWVKRGSDINLVSMNGRLSATYDVCSSNFITVSSRPPYTTDLDAFIIFLCKINKALTTLHPICHHLRYRSALGFSFPLASCCCTMNRLFVVFVVMSILFHFMYLVFSSFPSAQPFSLPFNQ